MPFLSHGILAKLENMAETGKHNLKFVESGKVFLEAAESCKNPKRQWKVVVTGKPEKKLCKARKHKYFLRKPRNGPPINPLFTECFICAGKHMFDVHNEGTGFDCADCGAKFYSKSHLRYHMQSKHGTVKRYQCDRCPKAFRFGSGLRNHQLSHTGGWLGCQGVEGGGE